VGYVKKNFYINFSEELLKLTEKKIQNLGLKIISADIKDIMFPGELKKIFTQVVKVRKEGLAILEKARGETAALRNLANAANMVEKSPNYKKMRTKSL